MITRAGVSIVILAVVFFIGSFAGTVVATSSKDSSPPPDLCSPMLSWLEIDDDQREAIEARDAEFAADLKALCGELYEVRRDLATLFEKDDSTDDELRRGVERVIEVHNRRERRVADYIIAIRQHLTCCQRKKLLDLCAAEVRRQCDMRLGGKNDSAATSYLPTPAGSKCRHLPPEAATDRAGAHESSETARPQSDDATGG